MVRKGQYGVFGGVQIPSDLQKITQGLYTDKKENQIFLIYKEIHNRAVAKSYMRKGFLIWGNAQIFTLTYMNRPLIIYDFATAFYQFTVMGKKALKFPIATNTIVNN